MRQNDPHLIQPVVIAPDKCLVFIYIIFDQFVVDLNSAFDTIEEMYL